MFFLSVEAVGKGMVVLRFLFLPYLSVTRFDEDSLAFSVPFRWMSQCF